MVLRMTPQASVNEDLVAYVDFDLDDQEVSSIAFSFSLHRQSQLGNGFKSNYKAFKIYTSTDGVNWTLASDETEFVKNELNKDEGLAGMTAHKLEKEFDSPTHFVRIACEAKSFTGSFSLVIDEVTLSNKTITHVEKPNVAVNEVSITCDATSVRKNNSITLGCTIDPSEATNKVVYWTSSKPNVAYLTRNTDGTVTVTGRNEGTTTIKVYTNEKDNNGNAYYDEVEITVLGAPTMPEEIKNNSYSNTSVQLYFTFTDSSLSATYLFEGVAVSDTLALTNERNGVYTFSSASSFVKIDVISASGDYFEVTAGTIKGVDLQFTPMNKVS